MRVTCSKSRLVFDLIPEVGGGAIVWMRVLSIMCDTRVYWTFTEIQNKSYCQIQFIGLIRDATFNCQINAIPYFTGRVATQTGSVAGRLKVDSLN